jgi:iron complex outermembrane recepter protein
MLSLIFHFFFYGYDMTHRLFILALFIITPITLFAEEATTLAPVTVEGEYLTEPGISEQDTDEIIETPADAGDFLRRLPGVSGTRMGGHGIDPIIRGQSQNQLNILLDGAYVHGGCPNRMDPPTSYSPVETYDTVKVIKGSQTVRYGGGGSGGTVLLERETPRLKAGQYTRGEVGGGYRSNSETKHLFGDMTAGTTEGFARAMIEYQEANNYKDGRGQKTRSAYTTKTGNLIFGYTPDEKTRLEVGLEANRADDILYAGAGMDSPQSDNDTLRVKYQNEWGTRAELYYSDVEHVMDNYSLRSLTAPMKMRVPSKSKTQGGRISHDLFMENEMAWTVGLDYQHNNRQANRFAGPATVANPSTLQSIMWPDVDLTQMGIFAEMEQPVREVDLVKMGLRYDHVTSEAHRIAQGAMGGMTPNHLYQKYYGKTADAHDENNLGGFLRYEHTLGEESGVLFASLSRSVRTADATERFLAANHNMPMMRWVGNPDLAPEQHHQFELGITWQQLRWETNASIYYNQVTDYILRDRAHSQDGIWQNDNATIYRNVDAELYGFEWGTQFKFDRHFTGRFSLDYVHATNTTDDRPIAQTPPLTSTLNLTYQQAKFRLGANLLIAAQQTRVDDNMRTGSGLDAEKTHGFSVLDIYSEVNLNKQMAIKLGINNVFDRTYAYHVNRANVDPFNPEPIQVNEPGRAYWLNLNFIF